MLYCAVHSDQSPLYAVLCCSFTPLPLYAVLCCSLSPLSPICSIVLFTQSALPYMLYCAVHSATPVCCTKHSAHSTVPLLQHSLYGDHMQCLHRWIISPKLYFPYKQVLPAVCPIRHCLDRSLSVNSCHQLICTGKAKMDNYCSV